MKFEHSERKRETKCNISLRDKVKGGNLSCSPLLIFRSHVKSGISQGFTCEVKYIHVTGLKLQSHDVLGINVTSNSTMSDKQ
jgi:hypothetical protein